MTKKIKMRLTDEQAVELWEELKQKGIHLRDLERQMCISHQTLSYYIRGNYSIPNYVKTHLEQILDHELKVDVIETRYFLTEDEQWKLRHDILAKGWNYPMLEKKLNLQRGCLSNFLNGRIAIPQNIYDGIIDILKKSTWHETKGFTASN